MLRKIAIVSILIVLAAGVGTSYLIFGLMGEISSLEESYQNLLQRYNKLAENYTALKSSYSSLQDSAIQQHFQRNSVRVIVYALGGANNSVEHGVKIVEALEQDSRIRAVLTRNQSDLNLENLKAKYDAVILFQHNENGQPSLLSKERIADLIAFAESGHMLVAVHHAIFDPNRENPTLNIRALTDYVGGYLPGTSPQGPIDGFQNNILRVVNSTHYLAEGISNFTVEGDEVYFAISTSEDIVAVVENKDYGPFVWSRGNYAVYMQVGHFAGDFDHPMVRRILQNAVLHLPIGK